MPGKKSNRIGQGDRLQETWLSMNGFFFTQGTLQPLQQAQSSPRTRCSVCSGTKKKPFAGSLAWTRHCLEEPLSEGITMVCEEDGTGCMCLENLASPQRMRGFHTPKAAAFSWVLLEVSSFISASKRNVDV